VKRFITLLIVVSLCLFGCDHVDLPSSSSREQYSQSSQANESHSTEEHVENSLCISSKPESSAPVLPSEPIFPPKDYLSKEDLQKLGEQALEKWIQIGHSLTSPLYNTDLERIGQEECRQIYSVYIYHNDLDESLVFEESVPQSRDLHWTKLKGIEEFTQNYFGCSFSGLEKNLEDSRLNGENIAFYFNGRFNVLADDLVQYTLQNCVQMEDGTFAAEIHVKFQDPNLDEYFGEPNIALRFFLQENNLCFLGASFDEKQCNQITH